MKERKKEKKRTLNMIFSTIITNTFKMGGFDGRTEQNGEGKRRRDEKFCLFNFQKTRENKNGRNQAARNGLVYQIAIYRSH